MTSINSSDSSTKECNVEPMDGWRQCKTKAESELAATATAVAKGVAKNVLYLNAW